ncbi:Cytochrome P450 71A23 [Cardamine amara subsp. amara]|uniref:Cytochrome P450 71A23 n=1 Tax=Cardamine amara subsp. amara TaxID=228776 RepID=A0ABD0Z3Z9_CARAN
MLLYFGSIPVIVASTADAAREVLKMHDRELASRPRSKIYEKLLYNGRNTASVSYGEYWRQLKSVSVLPSYLLQSNKMICSFRDIREEVT